MLREYNTRPQTVLACMIEDAGTVTKIKAGEYKYEHRGTGASKTLLNFSVDTKKEPVAGDFIIYQGDDDVYHCPADVFNAKYKVQGGMVI